MGIWITLAALFGALLAGTPAHAQGMTLSPFRGEFGRKASGAFNLINENNRPITFVIDAYSVTFSKETQGPVKKPLEIPVRLSQTSGRLSPKESREISFKFECPADNCQIMIMSTLTMERAKDEKMNVRVMLPFTAYSCAASAHDCRKKTLAAAGVVPPEDRPAK